MCSRKIEDEIHTFGTTGYTMNRVFVLYDRNTDSIWYPLGDRTFDAVSGARKGTQVPFLSEQDPVSLGDWLEDHPDSLVLMPPAEDTAPSNAGFLGVRMDPEGGGIAEVVAGSGAASAGLLAGDRILRIGDHEVGSRDDLLAALRDTRADDVLTLVIERDGVQRTLEVTLGSRPGN